MLVFMISFRTFLPALTIILACATPAASSFAQVFTNQAPAYGINAYDWNGHYGAAVSTADWNDDGWADITLGASEGALRGYVNLAGDGFEVFSFPWITMSETKALLWVDLDNDGDDDLFIQEENGRCGLLRHEEDGTFTDVTSNSDLTELNSNLPQLYTEAAGASFGDMDNDGDLDLHLCRYVGLPFFEGANHNVLLRNDGNFVFTDISASSGIGAPMRLSFQSLWWDHNNDGLQDILVINDKDHPNALFENMGDGTFVDVAPEYNLDIVIDCMSATLGDFNQDQRQDLFHTNTYFGGDGLGSKLFVRKPDQSFEESAAVYNLDIDEFCWGAVWMDVDNDTDLDLFVAEHDLLNPYGVNYLWQNQIGVNDGDSTNASFAPFNTSVYDLDYLNAHVVASADFDHNGWIDFVMHNLGNHAARVWMNGGFDNGYNSMSIALEGIISNRPAVGSKIELHGGGVVQTRIIHAGENYLSQETEAELFGLGSGTVSHATVHWPSGLTETFSGSDFDLNPGTYNTLKEGTSACPDTLVDHVICHATVPLNLDVIIPSPFESIWTSEGGQIVNVDANHLWQPNQGNLTMTAYWENQAMCSVTHHVELMPLLGDFNEDGVLGNADVLALLTDLGCIETCYADLDNNGIVGSSDLLLMLTLFGTSCE